MIHVPIMLISGAGGGDDAVITLEDLTSIYDQISRDKVMARRVNTDHGSNATVNDGYVMAWFMWQLQGDKEAAKAFTGDTPEIMANPLYQDQKVSLQS